MLEYNDKVFKRVSDAGVSGIVVGVILIIIGISLGVVSIVFGTKALKTRKHLI